MRYLNIVHIPMARASSGSKYVIGALWLEDIRAHVRALDGNGRFAIAAPIVDRIDPMDGGSFNTVEVDAAAEQFNVFELPYYINMKQYMLRRRELTARLQQAIEWADVVHMGVGGHPVPVGQDAWPVAGRLNKRRVFVFDGSAVIDRWERHAGAEPNPVRRLAKHVLLSRFVKFCRRAVRDADLVFTHNRAIATRFAAEWDHRCHVFDRSFVTPDMLISKDECERRAARVLEPGPLRLVAAGRQIAIKGTDHVLRAMARACASGGADIKLDVLGDGDDLSGFQALAAELGLANRVRFLGTMPYGPALFETMKESHALVVTNLTTEISRNVMIGMAIGLPLLSYRNPGADDVIEQSGAGVLVPIGDVDALATAMLELYRDRRRLAQMIQSGQEAAEANTLDFTHRRRVELIRQMMRGDAAPAGAGGAVAMKA